MVRQLFAMVMVAIYSGLAFAQEVISTATATSTVAAVEGSLGALLSTWPGAVKIMAFVVSLQVFLRGLAELLTKISDYTANTWDNKAAAWVSEAAWVVGLFLSKFGYGTPSAVIQDKVDAKLEAAGKQGP